MHSLKLVAWMGWRDPGRSRRTAAPGAGAVDHLSAISILLVRPVCLNWQEFCQAESWELYAWPRGVGTHRSVQDRVVCAKWWRTLFHRSHCVPLRISC